MLNCMMWRMKKNKWGNVASCPYKDLYKMKKREWSNGIAEWTDGNTAFVSSVFSWNAQNAFMRCVHYRSLGYYVRAGGQSVYQFPKMFSEFDTSGEVDALSRHNKYAVFTSRGCIRNCTFCLVPKMEGKLIELDDWAAKPIICDNNLLATSWNHFDKVIDKLLKNEITGIDFNQGLDARLLTISHAKRLAELPKDTLIRLAWDHIKNEREFMGAFNSLVSSGIRPHQIRAYVLIGYIDTPEDALYRLEKIRSLGALPNPMRYQPLDAKKKNSYIGQGWTERELMDYMRYYSKLNWLGHIQFKEYQSAKKLTTKNESQLELL